MNLPEQVGLGKRLVEISELVISSNNTLPYDQIWDCCCDHGYLGIALLKLFHSQNRKTHINFVDQVEHITLKLKSALKHASNKTYTNYSVITQNVAKLCLNNNDRHCVIIAGVTANGLMKILKTLLSNHRQQTIDFVLCPTRGIYDLRQLLIENNMHLIHEAYVFEKSRHYEVLHVRFQSQTSNKQLIKTVTSIGEFWKQNNNEHIAYLNNRISHFKKEANDSARDSSKQALSLYSEKLIEINSGD